VIVVDGGSEDDTVAVAARLADRVLQSGRGRARQMNAGAGVAAGELLWFLHADTLADHRVLGQLQEAARLNRSWGRFDVRLAGRPAMLSVVAWMMNRRSCWTGIATGDQGIFVQRRLFESVGGFPEMPLMEDVALSRRLKRHARPACLRGPLLTSGRRWERDGVWRTIVLMWRLRLAYACGADPELLRRRYR
jgi:rSAM/selenodomain-associated transferase 2